MNVNPETLEAAEPMYERDVQLRKPPEPKPNLVPTSWLSYYGSLLDTVQAADKAVAELPPTDPIHRISAKIIAAYEEHDVAVAATRWTILKGP